MKNPISISLLTLSAATFAFAGSSCTAGADDQSVRGTERRAIEPADSPAYFLGRQHGQQLLDRASTSEELRDGLLDIRAREHIIRTQVGESSADAYVEGVERQIVDSGDTLATALRLGIDN